MIIFKLVNYYIFFTTLFSRNNNLYILRNKLKFNSCVRMIPSKNCMIGYTHMFVNVIIVYMLVFGYLFSIKRHMIWLLRAEASGLSHNHETLSFIFENSAKAYWDGKLKWCREGSNYVSMTTESSMLVNRRKAIFFSKCLRLFNYSIHDIDFVHIWSIRVELLKIKRAWFFLGMISI